MLTVCWPPESQIQSDVEYASGDAIHEFRMLRRRKLQMHPAKHVRIRNRVESLRKLRVKPKFFKEISIEWLRKHATIVCKRARTYLVALW